MIGSALILPDTVILTGRLNFWAVNASTLDCIKEIALLTNLVVASWSVLVPISAVGAVGTPVIIGDSLNSKLLSWAWEAVPLILIE